MILGQKMFASKRLSAFAAVNASFEIALSAWSRRCVVTECRVEGLLEVAHIVPHAAGADYRTAHGLGRDVLFLLDESEFEKDGKRFLVVACVTTEQIEQVLAYSNINKINGL